MKKLDANEVAKYAKAKKKFSTLDVVKHFKVRKMQAAAGIAILRIKEVVNPGNPAKDSAGVSQWVWVGG